MIRQAVILAAGSGARLGTRGHKSLTVIGGKPVLGWILDALGECGVRTVHVIVNPLASELKSAARHVSRSVNVSLVECEDWELGNGRSAAAAAAVVEDERFFLLMSDHLIGVDHLRCVARGNPNQCVLGVSETAPWIDIDDATKVVVASSGAISDIGKELRAFNGIDTGVFAMTSALFPALEAARQAGQYSLTAGNRQLCHRNELYSAPIAARWYDIDTPADLLAANAWLAQAEIGS